MITYTPTWENNFDFECEYISHWYNDFNFPDLGCGNILGDFEASSGEIAAFAITVGEEWLAYHGQALAFDLTQTVIPWEMFCYGGEVLQPRVSPSYSVGTVLGHGDHIAVDLKTTGFSYLFPSGAKHGESLAFDISRQFHLSSDLYDGSLADSNIRYSVLDSMKAVAFCGENIAVDMQFDSIAIKSHINHGEQCVVAGLSTIRPTPVDVGSILDGSNAECVLSNYYQLGMNITSGENIALEITKTQDGLYRAHAGERLDVSFMAENHFSPACRDGVKVDFELTTRAPVRIESTAYDGHSWDVDLHHLYSPALYPYPIVNDSWFDVAIDPAWLHFSTCRSCKLPIYHDDFLIRLERFEDIRTTWSAEIEAVMSFELSRDIRPELVSFGGEYMAVSMDVVTETEISPIIDGSTLANVYLTTEERIDTDKNNPIPDGDDIISDNGLPDATPEQFVNARSGEYVLANLGVERHIEVNISHGNEIIVDLTPDKPMEFDIRDGQELRFDIATTISLWPNVFDGSDFEPKIYEPPVRIEHGEQVEFWLKLTYDVEWQETGCLDNEWTYDNKTLNTTVTVEQTPFRHSLKARCY